MNKLKITKNLLKKLINDEKSIFYATDRITRMLLNKAGKSLYKKDRVFYKYYLDLSNREKILVVCLIQYQSVFRAVTC